MGIFHCYVCLPEGILDRVSFGSRKNAQKGSVKPNIPIVIVSSRLIPSPNADSRPVFRSWNLSEIVTLAEPIRLLAEKKTAGRERLHGCFQK